MDEKMNIVDGKINKIDEKMDERLKNVVEHKLNQIDRRELKKLLK
ncbi:MAG: hypothetical protein P4L62_04040 [Candidatus Pacebacteria bacterium]|nr:hypothetical protein [Candidatus Paceibacterota bacterium]